MPGIQLKVLPRIPASVVGISPIEATKSGLTYSIGLDLTALAPAAGTSLGQFLVANLPVAPAEGSKAYALNGRKVGLAELAGAGTGVWVYYSLGEWRTESNDAPVLS